MRTSNDVISAATATFGGTATTYSEIVDVSHQPLLSLAVTATIGGGGNGVATLQFSNDKSLWFDSATYTKAFAASGSELWNIVDLCPHFVRVKNVALAGTQALSCRIAGKGV